MATKNFAANLKIGAVMAASVNRVFGGLKTKLKDQEATLKGLRAAYKEASKGTGEYAGKLDELKGKIAAAERQMLRLRNAAKFDIGKSLKGIGSTFKSDLTRGGIAGGVLGGLGIGVAKNMLNVTASFEKALTVLKTVEGSSEKAQKSFGWIQEFGEKTPYELQQVLDGFVKLKAYGIDPIKGDALKILGDTASAMGKDLNDAVEAIADAVTGENERLKEFGIKAAKEGGKITYEYTDRAGKQMRKTVAANNRAAIQSTILAIWNSKYKGAMDDQSKTWNGMVSNMQDMWAKFAYQVMQSGPFEHLKKQLQQFLDQLNVWAKDGTMQLWAEKTGKFMVEAGKKIGAVAVTLFNGAKAVADFLGGWDRLGYAIVAINFAPTIVAIGQMTTALWALTGATTAALGKWMLLAAAVTAMMSVVGDGNPLEGLKFTIKAIGRELTVLGEIISEQTTKFSNFLGRNMEALAMEIDTMIFRVRASIDNFYKGLTEGANTAIVAIKTAFDSFFTWIETKWNSVGSSIDAMWNRTKKLGSDIKGFFSFGGDEPAPAIPRTQSSITPAPSNRGMAGIGNGLPKAGQILAPASAMPAQQASVNQNNNVHINVSTTAQDGARFGRELRQELQRKPLFDMDGALVPA